MQVSTLSYTLLLNKHRKDAPSGSRNI